MPFTLVVGTTTTGIHGWLRNGFQIVGTLPGAFHHKQLGDVDALERIQSLVERLTPPRGIALAPWISCLRARTKLSPIGSRS